MAASGKTTGGLVPAGKVTKSPRSTVVPSQPPGRMQTTLTSATSRRGGASAPPLQSRKSAVSSTASVVSSTMNQRGLKLRPANPSVLPVLCVYSDQNQLVRKEQFRVPPAKPRSNNENLLSTAQRPSHIPVATQARAIPQFGKSTISSTARVGSNNTSNVNGAKRSKMTVPRATAATKVSQPVASSNKGNTSQFLPSEHFKIFPKVLLSCCR